MTAEPAATGDAARLLWEQVCRQPATPADIRATAEQLLTMLDAGLRRWIGAEGYAALLKRATAMTLPAHAALMGFDDLGIEHVPSDGNEHGRQTFTEPELTEAIIALLTTMMTLLGGIIGTDMAIRLLTLSGKPSTRGLAGPKSNDTGS